MKPTTNLIETFPSASPLAAARKPSKPKIDCAFRATTLAGFGGRCKRSESFRSISAGYFASEAPRAFAVEAAFFALITAIAALPIVSSIGALIHLVRVF